MWSTRSTRMLPIPISYFARTVATTRKTLATTTIATTAPRRAFSFVPHRPSSPAGLLPPRVYNIALAASPTIPSLARPYSLKSEDIDLEKSVETAPTHKTPSSNETFSTDKTSSLTPNTQPSPSSSGLNLKSPKRSKSWNLPSFDEYDRQYNAQQKKTTLKPNVPPNWRQNKELPDWKRQMFALREKFNGQAWNPTKKVSRDTMELIRLLKQSNPYLKSSEISERFKISPESVRRILKSKWLPNEKEADNISDRWKRRRESINKTASVKNAVDQFAQDSRAFKKLRGTPGDHDKRHNHKYNNDQGTNNRKKSHTKKVTRLQDMIF